jgi:hypothetical protein
VRDPRRILTDGSIYMYGGVLCEGMRFDDDAAEPLARDGDVGETSG